MAKKGNRSQPRIKGVSRIPSYSGLLPQLRRAVDAEARYFNVSRSFVIATAIADSLGVEMKYRYDSLIRKRIRSAPRVATAA